VKYARDKIDAAQTAICDLFSHANKVTAKLRQTRLQDGQIPI
jgi:hypothetical protein